MNPDRTLPRETLAAMVRTVSPSATLHEAKLAPSGHLSVYQIVVETSTGTSDWVLKASPDGEPRGVDTEARLLTLLEEKTSIPVPRVIGVVDTHETLPAPFFLMEHVEGATIANRAVGELSDSVLKRVAHQTGGYLAELHTLDGLAGYGQLAIDPAQSLSGTRPAVDPTQLTITDLQGASSIDRQNWPVVLRTWAEHTLEEHETTRFANLTEELRTKLLELIEALEGPFHPVLGRIDHGFHNMLIEPDTGEITGLIDWAFTLSVPPAYDLVCVEANLSLDPWSVHPATPNRRPLIRERLLAGYRQRGPTNVTDRFHRHHSTYELLALLRAMNYLEVRPEFVMPDATEEQVDATARAYRNLVTELLC